VSALPTRGTEASRKTKPMGNHVVDEQRSQNRQRLKPTLQRGRVMERGHGIGAEGSNRDRVRGAKGRLRSGYEVR